MVTKYDGASCSLNSVVRNCNYARIKKFSKKIIVGKGYDVNDSFYFYLSYPIRYLPINLLEKFIDIHIQ